MSCDQEIRISRDGDQWCALRGEDLQTGEAGFGPTAEEALDRLLYKTEYPTPPHVMQRIVALTHLVGRGCSKEGCLQCPAAIVQKIGSKPLFHGCVFDRIRGLALTAGDNLEES